MDDPVRDEETARSQCEHAIDGTLTPPFLEPDEISAWMEKSGIGAKDLYACTASVMKNNTDEYETALEESFGGDPNYYWAFMNQSVSQCQISMRKG